ncbi:MAG: hypothetical protein J6P93_05155 [Alphaproteobacteria bacterium]|nr:hypothetical protein [Alphaproteobacteria bacterium]
MPAKQKKSVKKKTTVKKQPVAKKVEAPKAVEAKVAEPVMVEKPAEKKAKKVYEISPFFHAVIVIIVFLLYVEIILSAILLWNYDFRIEKKIPHMNYHRVDITRPCLRK